MRCEVVHQSRPRVGERVSGDAVFVRSEGSVTLLVLIDALGHGETAAAIAALSVEAVAASAPDCGVREQIEILHRALEGTRGAAALVLRIELRGPGGSSTLTGCSVGNVELRSCHTRVPVVLSPGVLGVRLAKARLFEAELGATERLVAFSDGISSRFELGALARLPAREACEGLMSSARREHDDATVAIVDVRPKHE